MLGRRGLRARGGGAGDPPPTVELCVDLHEEAARVLRHVHSARAEGAAEIAILVRARGHLAAILPALRAAGIPFAAVDLEALSERLADLDYQERLGPVRINMSGCINACGHHHVGHIGILGVEKNGEEFYQITIGGRADEHRDLQRGVHASRVEGGLAARPRVRCRARGMMVP